MPNGLPKPSSSRETTMSAAARILVVGDEELVTRNLQRTLTHLGYEVCGLASTGDQAIQMAHLHLPSLVLMDVALSGPMDGIEAADHIGRALRIPVIYMAAHASTSVLERAKSTQPYGFLISPFSEENLWSAIETALHTRTTEGELQRSEHLSRAAVAHPTDPVCCFLPEVRNSFCNDEQCRSAHKQVKEDLRKREEWYRELVERSPDGIFVVKDEHYAFANAAAVRMAGLTNAADLVGRHFLDIVPAARHQSLRCLLETTLEQREIAVPTLEKIIRGDGTTLDVEASASAVMFQGQPAVQIVVRDMSARISAHEASRIDEERFRAIFETSPDCICIKDRSLCITHANPAVERLYGLPLSRLVGLCEEELYDEQAAQHIGETELRVIKGESIDEEHTRTIGGVRLTFHDIRMPVRNREGAIVGLCVIARNITDRKRVVRETHVTGGSYPSPVMAATLQQARLAAATDSIILLSGESGTGKDWLARWIHARSRRGAGPFFSINCAAVPHDLAESELFGHEAGAFTGAGGRKKGLFELAEGGTLLLNEIGELSLGLQSKLLAFLDTRSFLRVGGEKSVHVDARLIAATHRNIEAEVVAGRFLAALFYRLNVFAIEVPALRDRIHDIPVLVKEIVSTLAVDMQLSDIPRFHPTHLQALSAYHWPGNIRELRNVLERSLMLSPEGRLALAIPLPDKDRGGWKYTVSFPPERSLRDVRAEVTQALCAEAIRHARGNRTHAARLLGISRDSLYRYLKESEEDARTDEQQ
jgi:PAS domain S-box-containing protein